MSDDFSESSNSKLGSDENKAQDASSSIPIPRPLDLSTATAENSATLSNSTLRAATPNFLNAPKDTFSNDVSVYTRQNVPRLSKKNTAHIDSVHSSQNTLNSKPEDLSVPTFRSSEIITSQELSIDESKSRVTVRFLLKKSKRFCGAIRFYLSKSVTTNSSKFKSLMSSLKDSVKNTLANNVPSSKTLRQITNTLVSTLKGHRLPECLRFRGFSLTSIHKRKKHKHYESKTIIPMYSRSSRKFNNGTFLNPIKKPEFEDPGGFQFAKPKMYECGYCSTRFYKMPLYLKHIRRHAEIIRCDSCDKAFLSVINKRRHQIQCHKKAIYYH